MSASLGSLYFYFKKGIRLQGARKPLLNFYKEGVEGGGGGIGMQFKFVHKRENWRGGEID